MMDLTKRGLPNVVTINGSPFSIYTDFRKWMRFEIEVGKLRQGENIDVSYLFKNEMPPCCNLRDLFVFSRPVSELPRLRKDSDVIALDYEIDADYIYSAFMGQYGIDLIEIEELHWHKFLALLKGLREGEVITKIMSYRCYEKEDSNKDIYEELRYSWQIERITEEEQARIEEFSNLFT